MECIFWTTAREIIRACVQSEYKDLVVRVADFFRADREFRRNFGRAVDKIVSGENTVTEAFQTYLGRLNGEIRLHAFAEPNEQSKSNSEK